VGPKTGGAPTRNDAKLGLSDVAEVCRSNNQGQACVARIDDSTFRYIAKIIGRGTSAGFGGEGLGALIKVLRDGQQERRG
jgi:hypothetical protein